jgi:hypothetical protein
MLKYILSAFSIFIGLNLGAQTATVFGVVTDMETRKPIDYVSVFQESTANAVETDDNGYYALEIQANEATTIVFSRIGYEKVSVKIPSMVAGAKRNVNVKLSVESSDLEVTIRGSRIEDVGVVREQVTEMMRLPSTTGNLESVLPSIALGTSSGSGGELSSQYNVRGGNYDENLVYVNDFEIFRPQLIRSGQQEGLTFPNMDLIRDLSFSSGGFEAKYGDKMSSVLDISYKRPEDTQGSVSASLLGMSAHIEGSKRLGANAYNKLRFLAGARYKTNSYLLGSLDTKGEYSPEFVDVQAFITYDLTRDLQLGLMGNYNSSDYNFIPQDRTTALGLINFALRLTSVFEGGEKDQFVNGMGGISLTYIPERDKNPFFLKLLASAYGSEESERFDIIGRYRLAQIETDLGSDNIGTEVALLGTGTQHNYARNYLYNDIVNVQHKGGIELGEEASVHFLQWGIKYQHEAFDDFIQEWERLDSAGYSLPYDEDEVLLRNYIRSENIVSNTRYEAYFQDSYSARNEGVREMKVTMGLRAKYSSLNEEFILSPRLQFLYKPLGGNNNIAYKFAGGVYYQSPFYREMRRPDGTLNTNLKSQKSIHFVSGLSYDFYWNKVSKKPFKLITELYYKKLSNLASYEVDNVKIRYSGENDAQGHVIGLDVRVNGEFVPGAESWVNLSILSARENLIDVDHKRRELGESEGTIVSSVPRPTDRLFNLSMYFQDYLPKNENFKVNLNLSVGAGLPFGLRDNNDVYRNTYRYKAYHRIDIGFSYQLWDERQRAKRRSNPFSFSRNAWISLEVFNLMDISNVASNTWIKTITNTQYAIPNFLTSRRINFRMRVDI